MLTMGNPFKEYLHGMKAEKKERGRKGDAQASIDRICEQVEEQLLAENVDVSEQEAILKNIRRFCDTQTNIMLVGATGCGKSSTINALFACGQEEADCIQVAKVGTRADPETKSIEKYEIGNLVLWDTPGLGDGREEDEGHARLIRELLWEEQEDGEALIDLVLVVLEGSSRDLGTVYKVIREVILPELKGEERRILIALNQADVAMKTGRHWDYERNAPDKVLVDFLNEAVGSIHDRILADTGLEVTPIYYCAGYREEGGAVVRPYNLAKLLYYIMESLPAQKRLAVAAGLNTDEENYADSDEEMDYGEEVVRDIYDIASEIIDRCVDTCADFGGQAFGEVGEKIGAVVGGAVGLAGALFRSLFYAVTKK